MKSLRFGVMFGLRLKSTLNPDCTSKPPRLETPGGFVYMMLCEASPTNRASRIRATKKAQFNTRSIIGFFIVTPKKKTPPRPFEIRRGVPRKADTRCRVALMLKPLVLLIQQPMVVDIGLMFASLLRCERANGRRFGCVCKSVNQVFYIGPIWRFKGVYRSVGVYMP